MSIPNLGYTAPEVSEYSLDPGGNYVSPATDAAYSEGRGTLSASIIE